MKTSQRLWLGAILPIALIAIYWLQTYSGEDPYFPPISEIVERFVQIWIIDGRLMTDALPSLWNLLLGFVLAVVIGLLVGLVLGRLALLRRIFLPLMNFGRSIPPIMLIPPLVLVMGIGDESKVAIIAFAGLFPVALATIDGLRRTEPSHLDVARAVQLSRWKTLTDIYLPGASPAIFGGIQVSLQICLVLMISSEMLAAVRGLGYITMRAQLSFDTRTMWAGIVLLSILGFALNAAFDRVRHRSLAWHYGMRELSKAS